MFLSFRYVLRPTRGQHRVLEQILESQRQLYNAALEERVEAWRKAGKSVTHFDQTHSLTQIRKDDPLGYGSLPALLSRWTLKRVDDAFQGFFRRLKSKSGRAGFPRFRGKTRWRSFGVTEFRGLNLIDGKLSFKGLPGKLKVHWHRPLPACSIRSCVFRKEGRSWFVILRVEIPESHTVRREAGDLVGIDWGVENLATLSTGEVMPNPRFGSAAVAAGRRAHRKLARSKPGSRRRQKAIEQLWRVQRRVVNRRRTYLHRVSCSIARRFGAIAVERLQVRNLTASAKGTVSRPGKAVRQKAGLNREILDTSPSMFIAMLRYKAVGAGGWFAVVDATNTSQECSECGQMARKGLKVRIHTCLQCETEVHRDVNAARNVLKRAVAGPWSGFAQQMPNVLTGGRRSGNLEEWMAA